MEKSSGRRHCSKHTYLRPAAGLSHYGDIRRIASEILDIISYPLQGSHDIKHSDIGRMPVFFTSDRGEIGESESIEPMVYRAKNYISATGYVFSIVSILLDAVSFGKAASVEPYKHRTLLPVLQAGSPHIQTEAILSHRIIIPMVREHIVRLRPAVVIFLRSRLSECYRSTDSLPRCRRLRRHKTVLTGGRSAVWNAVEAIYIVKHIAAHLSIFGFRNRYVLTYVDLLFRDRVCALSVS